MPPIILQMKGGGSYVDVRVTRSVDRSNRNSYCARINADCLTCLSEQQKEEVEKCLSRLATGEAAR